VNIPLLLNIQNLTFLFIFFQKSETFSTKSEPDTDYYSSCDEKSSSKTQESQSVSSCTEEYVSPINISA